jgi:23S rRNA pseudouridine1911/1915/1917 synthase
MTLDPIRWEGRAAFTLDKPAGLPVLPPHADPSGDCLLARLRVARPDVDAHEWPAGFPAGIAHRLDTPTSGQIVVARTPADLARIRASFRQRHFVKHYVFLTRKDVDWDSHAIDARLAHDRSRKDRMVVERGRDTPHRGRWYEARTVFERAGAAEGLFAWRATMSTGVTHQIRVHAAFAGLALAGDRLYGGGAPDSGWPVPFLLHHLGLEGPDVKGASMSPVPEFWPTLRGPDDPRRVSPVPADG